MKLCSRPAPAPPDESQQESRDNDKSEDCATDKKVNAAQRRFLRHMRLRGDEQLFHQVRQAELPASTSITAGMPATRGSGPIRASKSAGAVCVQQVGRTLLKSEDSGGQGPRLHRQSCGNPVLPPALSGRNRAREAQLKRTERGRNYRGEPSGEESRDRQAIVSTRLSLEQPEDRISAEAGNRANVEYVSSQGYQPPILQEQRLCDYHGRHGQESRHRPEQYGKKASADQVAGCAPGHRKIQHLGGEDKRAEHSMSGIIRSDRSIRPFLPPTVFPPRNHVERARRGWSESRQVYASRKL